MEILKRFFGKKPDHEPRQAGGPESAASWIKSLSLKASGIDLLHPNKEKAIRALEEMGAAALKPLVQALAHADDEAKTSIIHLLGRMKGERTAVLAIAEQLRSRSILVRHGAISALEGFADKELADAEVMERLKAAGGDKEMEIRKKARALLARLNVQMEEVPWHSGAEGWEEIARAFIEAEIGKKNPDFRGLDKQLQHVSDAEKHGAWARVAGALDRIDKVKSMRCYLEALHHNPIPNSVAWHWIDGHYDKEMNILPPGSPRTWKTVEEIRRTYGPISEE